jgi:uncharacterized delta-60 repeat protein
MLHNFHRPGLALGAALLSLTLLGSACHANSGQLDPTFSQDGKTTTDFGAIDSALGLALGTGGQVIAGGSSLSTDYQSTHSILCKYKNDGTLDSSFGGGKVAISLADADEIESLAVQSDGKIVASVNAVPNLLVARFNTNGQLDTSFGTGGKASLGISDRYAPCGLALQPDGKIVVAAYMPGGNQTMLVARFTSSGTLDSTFGTGGIVIPSGIRNAKRMRLQPDGKILVCGNSYGDTGLPFLTLWRLTSTGQPDTSFNKTGTFQANFADAGYGGAGYGSALAVQEDGKILAGGRAAGADGMGLVRLNPDGTPDATFSGDGYFIAGSFAMSTATDIAVQVNGKILVADALQNVYRFESGGSLDNTFGTKGGTNPNFGGDVHGTRLCLQDNGKIVIGGSTATYAGTKITDGNFAVARFDGDAVKRFTMSGRCISFVPSADFASVVRNGFEGATVSLMHNGNFIGSTLTDASGNYSFTKVPEGTYTLNAKISIVRDGVTRERFMDPNPRTVTVSGADLAVPRFALYSIFGLVRIPNQSGTYGPAAGATVELYNGNNVLLESTTTGTDGRYQFRRLFAGSFKVVAKLANYSFVPITTGLPSSSDMASPSTRLVMKGSATQTAAIGAEASARQF